MSATRWVARASLGFLIACVGDTPATGSDSGTDGPVTDAATDAGDAAPPNDAAPEGGCGPCDAGCYGGMCGGNRVVTVGAGTTYGCAMLAAGEVWCWGSNKLGSIGVSPASSATFKPTRVAGLPKVKSLTVGLSYACAIDEVSDLYCWGGNEWSQLGHDPSGDEICAGGVRCQPIPQKLASLKVSQASAGDVVTCAVSTTGGVFCWGSDNSGLFGSGAAPKKPTTHLPQAVAVLGAGVSSVSMGQWPNDGACAVTTTNKLYCWGGNHAGQLGHSVGGGTPVDQTTCAYAAGATCNTTPQKVTNNPDGTGGDFDNVASVITGWTTCAVRLDGTLWCWGDNREYQLANGGVTNSAKPVQVGLSSIGRVSGSDSMCAQTKAGQISCWGNGGTLLPGSAGAASCYWSTGTLGSCVTTPTAIPMPGAASGLEVSRFTAIVTIDGKPYAWGANTDDQLGHPNGTQGDIGGVNGTPKAVEGLP